MTRLLGLELHDDQEEAIIKPEESKTRVRKSSILDMSPSELKKRIEDQAQNNTWHRFVQGNCILKQGLVDKRKVLTFDFSVFSIFVITCSFSFNSQHCLRDRVCLQGVGCCCSQSDLDCSTWIPWTWSWRGKFLGRSTYDPNPKTSKHSLFIPWVLICSYFYCSGFIAVPEDTGIFPGTFGVLLPHTPWWGGLIIIFLYSLC